MIFPNVKDPGAAAPPNSLPDESVSQIELDEVCNKVLFEEFVYSLA